MHAWVVRGIRAMLAICIVRSQLYSGEVMIASISLDLDNKWSYMKTHGDAGWESFPTYLDVVVPRVLDLFDELGITLTFFVVGQDADRDENHPALRSIADRGHEIGNHSYHHEPWLHLYSKDRIVEEFVRSEACIERATGQKTIGFRGPGFSYSQDGFRWAPTSWAATCWCG